MDRRYVDTGPLPDGTPTFACSACGCLVVDVAQHESWHDTLISAIGEAAATGRYADSMLRPLG